MNGKDDVFATKKGLTQMGDWKPVWDNYDHPTSEPEETFASAVEGFQGRYGLKRDGLMTPGGPTEAVLRAETLRSDLEEAGQTSLPDPLALTQPVGLGQANTNRDVVSVRALFDHIAHPDVGLKGLAGTPPSIQTFQSKLGLKPDGILTPGGPTEAKLNQLAAPLLAVHRSTDLNDGIQSDGLFTPVPVSGFQSEERTAHLVWSQEPKNALFAKAPVSDRRPLAETRAGSAQFGSRPNLAQAADPKADSQNSLDDQGNQATLQPRPLFDGEPRNSEGHWATFHSAADAVGISPQERSVFGNIFSAEGGYKADGTTVAGITAKIINDLHNDQTNLWLSERLTALGIPKDTPPSSLTPEQQIGVYRLYFDDAIGPAKASDGAISGMEVLANTVGDYATIAAIADTLFRVGGGDGTDMIQKAINQTLADTGSEAAILEDGTLGSGNLRIIGDFAQDPETRKRFIDNLMDLRDQKYNATDHAIGEKRRSDFYRVH